MVLAFVFVVLTFIGYTAYNGRYVRATNHEYLVDDTNQSAKDISHVIEDGYRNIKIISELVSGSLTSETVDISNYQKLISNSVFDFIEYADKDGFDHNITGGTSDARDREYYLEAMKGNSGMEVIYNSRATHENLLMFYAPVYYENRIIGSIIGVYQASNRITEIISKVYFGKSAASYLCTSEGKVFASSEGLDFSVENSIADFVDVDDSNMQLLNAALLGRDSASFYTEGNKASGYATCIPNTEWMLVRVYPSSVNIRMIREMSTVALIMVVAILIIFITHQITVFYFHNRQEKMINDQLEILQSVADIYHSMHLIDLGDLSVTEYKSNELLRNAMKYCNNAVDMMDNVINTTITNEYLKAGQAFTDVTTLKKRLKDKKFIFIDLLGKNVGWIRMTFIKIEADDKGVPTKVIIATQVIDEDKRRELELLVKSNYDEMTGLYNRRAYDEAIGFYESNTENMRGLFFISADVNGLKGVNDNIGHAGGDEIIKAAANCLRGAFSKVGRVYRTGGDEFIVLASNDERLVNEAKADFDEMVSSWKGELVDSLSVSYACVSCDDYADLSIHEIEKIADKEMYKVKSQYYIDNNIDRRRR